jgi:signal transduction histidine kinase
MGGGITVTSEVGRGSSFTVRMPAEISADQMPQAEAA